MREGELTEQEMRRIETRWKSDVDLKLDRADVRLRLIERLVWIATGGVAVLGAVSMIGITILFGFASKLELVSNAQAVSIAETRINEDHIRRKMDSMQVEIEQLRQRVK